MAEEYLLVSEGKKHPRKKLEIDIPNSYSKGPEWHSHTGGKPRRIDSRSGLYSSCASSQLFTSSNDGTTTDTRSYSTPLSKIYSAPQSPLQLNRDLFPKTAAMLSAVIKTRYSGEQIAGRIPYSESPRLASLRGTSSGGSGTFTGTGSSSNHRSYTPSPSGSLHGINSAKAFVER
jgi:hypothetical protein